MAANYDITYNVDMVFVIDTTGSMRPVLDLVKNNALNFYNDVTQKHSRYKNGCMACTCKNNRLPSASKVPCTRAMNANTPKCPRKT